MFDLYLAPAERVVADMAVQTAPLCRGPLVAQIAREVRRAVLTRLAVLEVSESGVRAVYRVRRERSDRPAA